MSSKPSIVFAHGLWADGSCFSKVMGALQADGYECLASQHGLDACEFTVLRRTAIASSSASGSPGPRIFS
jgi:hypothetical protein